MVGGTLILNFGLISFSLSHPDTYTGRELNSRTGTLADLAACDKCHWNFSVTDVQKTSTY